MITRLKDWRLEAGYWAVWLVVSVGLAIGPSAAQATQKPWQLDLADAENDIEIHTRHREDGFIEFRGVTRLNTSLSSLVAILRDVERLPRWSYRTSLAMELERVSARERIIYTVAGLPWPFKDRDLVVRSRLQQDPVSLAVMVTAQALPDYMPVDPAYVRVPFLESSWTFLPLDNGVVEVHFKGFGDGGGSLSKGLLNWFSALVVSEAPYQTLIGLRQMVRQPRYQRANIAIIREPAGTSTVNKEDHSSPHGMSKRLSMMSPSSK